MTHISINEWNDKGDVVCRCDLYVDMDGNATIGNLKTNAACRKQGLAGKMLATAENIVVGMKLKTISMRVLKNSFMRDWYERIGYTVFAEDAENDDYVWVQKRLRNAKDNVQ